MEWNTQLHDPTPLPVPDTHWQGGWVGPRASVDVVARSLLYLLGIETPSPSNVSPCTGRVIREQDFQSRKS